MVRWGQYPSMTNCRTEKISLTVNQHEICVKEGKNSQSRAGYHLKYKKNILELFSGDTSHC